MAERTRNRLQGFHAAVGFRREEFKLFQAILHTQHQLRYRADPRDQRDGAVFGRRFQQGFGKTRADSELRAGFRYRFQLLNVGNRARADNRVRNFFGNRADRLGAHSVRRVTSSTRTPPATSAFAIGTACSSFFTTITGTTGPEVRIASAVVFQFFIRIFSRQI